MKTITLDPQFFAGELDMYNVTFMLVRELLQNSLDAGSTAIDIFEEDDWLHCNDNGCGMNIDTIDNVYMRLGRSKKPDDDSCGGFGRARIVTCFAQKEYIIRTRNIEVRGVGAGYDVKTSTNYVHGCNISIKLQEKFVGTLSKSMDTIAQLSNVPGVKLTSNGQRINLTCGPAQTASYVNGISTQVLIQDERTDMSFTRTYRVNGLVQFFEDSYTLRELFEHDKRGCMLFIDLAPAESRKILTASREAIRWNKVSQLNSTLRQLLDTITVVSKDDALYSHLRDMTGDFVEPSVPTHMLSCAHELLRTWTSYSEHFISVIKQHVSDFPEDISFTVYQNVNEDNELATHLTAYGRHFVRLNIAAACKINNLQAALLHELVHCAESSHNEHYASIFTFAVGELFNECLPPKP